jgi:hypothetical protein
MKYGHNKQFKILQYTAAAVPCKINESVHQKKPQKREAYSYFAFMATKSMSNNFKIETCRSHLISWQAFLHSKIHEIWSQ